MNIERSNRIVIPTSNEQSVTTINNLPEEVLGLIFSQLKERESSAWACTNRPFNCSVTQHTAALELRPIKALVKALIAALSTDSHKEQKEKLIGISDRLDNLEMRSALKAKWQGQIETIEKEIYMILSILPAEDLDTIYDRLDSKKRVQLGQLVSYTEKYKNLNGMLCVELMESNNINNKEKIEHILKEGAVPLNFVLSYAISESEVPLMGLLLNAGGNATAELLNKAIILDRPVAVQSLLEHGARLNAKELSPEILVGSKETLALVVEAGFKVPTEWLDDRIPSLENLKIALSSGTVPGKNTLIAAFLDNNSFKIIHTLIDAGAQVDEYALTMALISSSSLKVIQLLLARGIVPTSAHFNHAVSRGLSLDIMRALVEAGGMPDKQIIESAIHHNAAPETIAFFQNLLS